MSAIPIGLTALWGIDTKLALIREELQIMNCETQAEKDALRTQFKEDRTKMAKIGFVIMGIAFVVPVIVDIIRKSS